MLGPTAQHLGYGISCLTIRIALPFWFLVCSSEVCQYGHPIMHCLHFMLHSWRWAYGIGSMYSAIVVFLIAVFGEETYA